MADDVDPAPLPTSPAETEPTEPGAGPEADGSAAETSPTELSVDPEDDGSTAENEPLPSMADLDRVSSELDDIDARLASLDEQRS